MSIWDANLKSDDFSGLCRRELNEFSYTLQCDICTAKCADNSLLHSVRVANYAWYIRCSTTLPFDLKHESDS